ncbi:ImmA/IrrE family metallo-endopeptidase [Ensifer adhaerens]|uniref:ImmA/IrrE family metallo-endopeptidase n=1 Tax=Ensifer adhaerens TaxID=106592 RepID=UPI000807406E|nr:ImmA/IrrE family metallo-endopeptidase [Ensifer adhaerens]
MSPAERVIEELGITEPHEIDLEVIAFHLGATIKFCSLDGCEACIMGYGDKAIIRVSDTVSPQRRRFSIGHELGHWCHHRGRPLFCKQEDIGGSDRTGKPSPKKAEERVADGYAGDLLMPRSVFRLVARQFKALNFETIRKVAGEFDTSLTATAIRFVDMDHTPSMIVCHGLNGRKWFSRSKSVPERWFPKTDLDSESPAFDILHGKAPESKFSSRIGADAWFDQFDADRYEIMEQTIRTFDGEILTLLIFKDEKMLQDLDTRSYGGRR